MKTILAVLILSVGLSAPAAAWTHPDASEGPDDNASLPNAWSLQDRERAALARIAERLHRGDVNYAVIAQHLREVLDDAAFSTLTPTEQHYTWLVYGLALFNSRQFETAREPLRLASELPQADAVDWEFRLKNALALTDYAEAARTATQLARRWPERIAQYDTAAFATILSQTQRDPRTAGLAAELSAALAAAHSRTAGRS